MNIESNLQNIIYWIAFRCILYGASSCSRSAAMGVSTSPQQQRLTVNIILPMMHSSTLHILGFAAMTLEMRASAWIVCSLGGWGWGERCDLTWHIWCAGWAYQYVLTKHPEIYTHWTVYCGSKTRNSSRCIFNMLHLMTELQPSTRANWAHANIHAVGIYDIYSCHVKLPIHSNEYLEQATAAVQMDFA